METIHTGRRYVIVGGTSGMGLATARLLAQQGGRVAIVGRDAASASQRADLLKAETAGDILGEGGSGPDLEAAVLRAASALGGLDGLAVTAGPIESYGDAITLTDTDWAQSFETQLMTVVRAARVAIPIMAAGGGGSLVTMAAQSIHLQKEPLPHYAAMKSAIASLTKYLAKFHGKDRVRANCIAPGAIATEALGEAQTRAEQEFGGDPLAALWQVMRREWGSKAALDRVGEPREVAELIAFLLSREAGYLTGALINIDGGSDF